MAKSVKNGQNGKKCQNRKNGKNRQKPKTCVKNDHHFSYVFHDKNYGKLRFYRKWPKMTKKHDSRIGIRHSCFSQKSAKNGKTPKIVDFWCFHDKIWTTARRVGKNGPKSGQKR